MRSRRIVSTTGSSILRAYAAQKRPPLRRHSPTTGPPAAGVRHPLHPARATPAPRNTKRYPRMFGTDPNSTRAAGAAIRAPTHTPPPRGNGSSPRTNPPRFARYRFHTTAQRRGTGDVVGDAGLLGFISEARWLRHARAHLAHLFRYLPEQPGYNKRLRRTGLPKATVHRMCRDLVTARLLSSSPDGCRLGRGLFETGNVSGHRTHSARGRSALPPRPLRPNPGNRALRRAERRRGRLHQQDRWPPPGPRPLPDRRQDAAVLHRDRQGPARPLRPPRSTVSSRDHWSGAYRAPWSHPGCCARSWRRSS